VRCCDTRAKDVVIDTAWVHSEREEKKVRAKSFEVLAIHWEASLTTLIQWVVTWGVRTGLSEPATVLQYLPSTNPDGCRRRAKQD